MRKKIWLYLLLGGIITIIPAYFLKSSLPAQKHILPELLAEPIQSATQEMPFQILRGDKKYEVTPLFSYDLKGLIVSYRHTQDFGNIYHSDWGDFINVKDICVIWGENLSNGSYKKISFSSGSFHCYFKSRDSSAWRAFKEDKVSNNHLLADDDYIQKMMMNAEVGDQIHLKGLLVNYTGTPRLRRTSSTSRTDRGDTACEVVFVQDFEILKRSNTFWIALFKLCKILIPLMAAILLFDVFAMPFIVSE